MKVYHGLPKLQDQGRVVTLGVFDGIHRGHVKILHACRAVGQKLQLPAAVITFEDHPHSLLAPGQRPPRLATPSQCLDLIEQAGLDEVFLVQFTRALADTPAEDFVEKILLGRLRMRHMVVGQDFHFGQGGKGTPAMLRRLGKAAGFGVSLVLPLRDRGQIISSSRLRQLVAQGQVEQAHRWLGWPYVLHGKVVHGEGRGSRIGLPTANLKTQHEVIPAPGIYASMAFLEKRALPALCYIGKRPTFHPWGPETIEVYIPDWSGQLYGRPLAVNFLARLRGDMRFPTVAALLRQVSKDQVRARRIWAKYGPRRSLKSGE